MILIDLSGLFDLFFSFLGRPGQGFFSASHESRVPSPVFSSRALNPQSRNPALLIVHLSCAIPAFSAPVVLARAPVLTNRPHRVVFLLRVPNPESLTPTLLCKPRTPSRLFSASPETRGRALARLSIGNPQSAMTPPSFRARGRADEASLLSGPAAVGPRTSPENYRVPKDGCQEKYFAERYSLPMLELQPMRWPSEW
jgi:hypothetical protein